MKKIRHRRRRYARNPKNFVRFGDLHVAVREDAKVRRLYGKPFELRVAYRGYSRDVDRQLFKIVGAWSDGSGCFIAGSRGGLRDHTWYFANRTKMVAAYRRLLRANPLRVEGALLKGEVKLNVMLSGPYPANFGGFVKR